MSTTISEITGDAWQRSWDLQQESYLPDREERFRVMLDTLPVLTPERAPRVLDLAGGTGSISLRLLRRFPGARATLLDLDPVLLTIARSSLGGRIGYATADLRYADWAQALPHREYDAVLTATALHWLPDDRLQELYGEIREVLRPGGVFVNADHMPEDGLPTLDERFAEQDRRQQEALHGANAVHSWKSWWEQVAGDPVLGPLMAQREAVYGTDDHSAESFQPASWHTAVLRTVGYTEAGVVWRGKRDAAIAGIR